MSPATFAAVVAAAVFIGLSALAAWLILFAASREQGRLQRRLAGADAVPADGLGAPGDAPLLREFARRGQALEKVVDTEGESARLMIQAGWRDSRSRLVFYAFQGLLPLVLLLVVAIGWTLDWGRLFQAPLVFLIAVFAVILGILIPRWVLRSAAAGRRQRIDREVPLFVHLLVLLFEAGLSTRQALASMVRDGRGVLPELGKEIEVVLRQIEAGSEISDTLRRMAEALEVQDLETVVGVLRQVDRYGGEVRDPLLDALKVMEERRGLDMREKVNRMTGQMTVVMVLFFFPALFIFIAGPAFVSILKALKTAAAH